MHILYITYSTPVQGSGAASCNETLIFLQRNVYRYLYQVGDMTSTVNDCKYLHATNLEKYKNTFRFYSFGARHYGFG